MDKENFIKKIQEIGGCEDEVQRRTLLAEVNTEVSKVYDERDSLNASKQGFEDQIKKANEDLETLRKANMDLFLKVGAQKSEAEIKKDTTGIDDKKDEKLKFEDLFNDKGGIK